MNNLKLRLLVLLNAAWRQRYVILVPILILPFVGFGVSKLAPTKYDAHTSMSPAHEPKTIQIAYPIAIQRYNTPICILKIKKSISVSKNRP